MYPMRGRRLRHGGHGWDSTSGWVAGRLECACKASTRAPGPSARPGDPHWQTAQSHGRKGCVGILGCFAEDASGRFQSRFLEKVRSFPCRIRDGYGYIVPHEDCGSGGGGCRCRSGATRKEYAHGRPVAG